MGLADKVPGMQPGNHVRNLIVVSVYIIVLSGVVGAIGSSGGDTPSPEATPTPTPTETPEPIDEVDEPSELTDSEILLALELTLIDHGYNVEYLEQNRGIVELDYRSAARDTEELAGEIGGVSGAYAVGVEAGWSVDRIEVVVLDSRGELAGSYWIESGWAREYNSGEMSGEEYIVRIMETIETYE